MKHLLYFKESLYTNFKEGDIVVSIIKDSHKFYIGHRYVVYEIDNSFLWVKDMVNNELIRGHINNFMLEDEYEMQDDIKKYNL